MNFTPEFIDKVRNSLPISEIVSRRVKLEHRSGKHVGLCPFHKEKTPSFSVSDEKGFYYCFGCNASGDAIKFLSETEGLGFVEAVQFLADRAGIEVPKQTIEQTANTRKIEKIREINEITCDWFKENLKKTTGSKAREYLKRRDLSKEEIEKFSIGFVSDGNSDLIKHLKKQGFSEEQIIEAGLASKSAKMGIYDRFRNRIIFPIFSASNKLIAFGGRAMGDNLPKYLNSPETELFKKSNVLYAESLAKPSAYKSGEVIIVEGYMDTISMHKHGFMQTVATLGTAITKQHLLSLWRMSKEPIICLDGDLAGQRAMLRLTEIAIPLLKEGYSLRFLFLPENKDPDDILKEDGSKFMREILDNDTIPLSELIWQTEYKKHAPKTPEQKAALEKRLIEISERIDNKILKKSYRSYFDNKLWENVKKYVRNRDSEVNKKSAKSSTYKISLGADKDNLGRYEYSLVAQLIDFPSLLDDKYIKEEFIRIDFSTEKLEGLRSIILEESEEDTQELDLKSHIQNKIANHGLAKELEFLCGKHSTFIDIFCEQDFEKRKKTWVLLAKKYMLAILQKEFKESILGMTEESFEKASEIKKQIIDLELLLKEKELNLNLEENTI